MKRFDLIGLGEALVELRRESPGVYRQSYAGDVFNTLYYASRLGLTTGFVSQFGSDHFTDDLIRLCNTEHIDKSYCKISQTRTNGLYTITTDNSGQPTFSFWRKESAASMTLADTSVDQLAEQISGAKHFLFSAIGLAVFKQAERIYDLLQAIKGTTRIYFDTNVRPALWEDMDVLKNHIERLAQYVDVIFVSASDDHYLFGERSAAESIRWYTDAGYSVVIHREGEKPTLANSESTGIIEVPTVREVTVIDATGAGDAFNAGFIFKADGPLEGAVRFGNACGALAVRSAGALAPDFSREVLL